MQLDKEITVRVNSSHKELEEELTAKGFRKLEEFKLVDIFLLSPKVSMENASDNEIINSCILIRTVESVDKIKSYLVYKNKLLDDSGRILEQSSHKLQLNDTPEKAEELLSCLGFKKLFTIEDYSTVWSNGEMEIATKQVKDQGLYIEYEASNGESDEELIAKFKTLELDVDESNFYVKKAYIALAKYKNNNKERNETTKTNL